ncbi:aspartate aminotransferase family protein [candidate division WOR-3 bacterium]|nr:aspartate aminotransferase family protein [candidate division WOR-3 bacterium]
MMQTWRTNPFEDIVLTHGEGCVVWDKKGRSYLDLLSGCWCSVLGHSHPRLLDVVGKQVSKLIHVGPAFRSEEVEAALHKIEGIVPPSLERTVFLNTGSEAVELAIKMARAATGADAIIASEGGYYGATTYALSLSEAGRNSSWLPSVESMVRIPAPLCRNCPHNMPQPCKEFPCLNELRDLCRSKTFKAAAILYEPALAYPGIIVPPEGYGAHLKELVQELDAFFIAEEVTTGVGRTGRWFGFEHDGIVPDILVLGKALGAGLPVAAVITTQDVEERCRNRLIHVQSHQNDPFSAAVAEVVISVIEEEELVHRAATLGKYLVNRLRELQSKLHSISEIRGRGLMIGIELARELVSKGPEISRRLLDAGFITGYQARNATFRLFPPYVIERKQLDEFLGAFEEILHSETR